MRLLRVLAVLVVVGVVGAACGRGGSSAGPAGNPANGTQPATPTTGAPGAGDFGTLKGVCGHGSATGATDLGVTDTTITVGTSADPGFAGRPGLDQELFDAGEVFVKWCNDAGGILGRTIKLNEYDAKLTDFQAQVQKGCQSDFVWAGNGNVFDNTGQQDRLKCLLPQIPGYVVSPEARNSDLTVQPVPNRTDTLPTTDLRYVAKKFPDAITSVATLTVHALPATAVVEEQEVEAAKSLGWGIVYRGDYNALGEPTWTPIAQSLKDHGAKGLLYTGEPANLALLEQALQTIGYKLDFILAPANHYDKILLDQGGSALAYAPTVIRIGIVPFEDAAKNPATQQYLDLFAKYKPSGKSHAALGPQAFSAWLLFATAARDCGSHLTRRCVYDNALKPTDWTGGGLIAPQDVRDQKAGTCGIMLQATASGFVRAPGFAPNQGLFECDPANVVTLHGDYGKGVTLADVGKSLADLK